MITYARLVVTVCHQAPCKKLRKISQEYSTPFEEYHIRSNYRTYPYKRTVKQFRSLQITACVFLSIRAYVVGTHLNRYDKSMQFKWVPTTYLL